MNSAGCSLLPRLRDSGASSSSDVHATDPSRAVSPRDRLPRLGRTMSIRLVLSLVSLAGTLALAPTPSAAIGAGCGESGPTRSDVAPFALIGPGALAINGRVR